MLMLMNPHHMLELTLELFYDENQYSIDEIGLERKKIPVSIDTCGALWGQRRTGHTRTPSQRLNRFVLERCNMRPWNLTRCPSLDISSIKTSKMA